MTPLRQRFIDDLRIRNYSPRTIEAYLAGVVRFVKHAGRSPDLLGPEDIRAFQVHLVHKGVSWSQFNQTVAALRFFYRVTLGRPEQLPYIPYGKRPKTLPAVLSAEEVSRLIQAAAHGRDRVLLQVAYGCGLRLSELLALQVSDIDSARNGNVQRNFRRIAKRAGLSKRCSMHTLRHSYATHLLEAGVDLLTLKELLGHRNLDTTAHYLHISTQRLQKTPSLLDLLVVPQAPPVPPPPPFMQEGPR